MIFTLVFLCMQQVYALSCDFEMMPEYDDVLPEYDLIFEGKMVERTTPQKTPPFNMWMPAGLYEFEIQKVWKGVEKLKNIKVWGSATYHGYSAYKKGDSYIVYVKYHRGYPLTSPGMCGPDHVYSETTMRELLAEYEGDMKSMQANTMDVELILGNDGTGSLRLSNPKSLWRGINHPLEHSDSLSFLIRDGDGNQLSPTTKKIDWDLKGSINLSKEEPFSTSISVLRYLQGNISYRYALEEGKTYHIVVLYSPFGADKYRFESNKVTITYTKVEK
ncbi:MAG: hypothetical protein CL916_13740 [Deltaproteobacteria bacterium]|nr:hypothetical protein [Deltaproteobacteria bacterium]